MQPWQITFHYLTFHQEEILAALDKVCRLLPSTYSKDVSSLYTGSSDNVQLVYMYCL